MVLISIGIILFILFIGIGPWAYRIYTTKGEDRYKTVCCLFQCAGFLITFLAIFGLLLMFLGERNDFIAAIALIGTMACSIHFGPRIGNITFVYIMQNKLGKVGAEQICRHAKF